MLFMKHKKEFKKLLNYYRSTGARTVRTKNIEISDRCAEYLAAFYVVSLSRLNNGETGYKITITDYGIRFFDEEHDKIFRFIIPTVISAASLLISVIALMK